MKNEVKKKMMMRAHQRAVPRSPERDVRLKNQLQPSSFTIADAVFVSFQRTKPVGAENLKCAFSSLRNVPFSRDDLIVALKHSPARASIMNVAKPSRGA
jgi:hypothetical protein